MESREILDIRLADLERRIELAIKAFYASLI